MIGRFFHHGTVIRLLYFSAALPSIGCKQQTGGAVLFSGTPSSIPFAVTEATAILHNRPSCIVFFMAQLCNIMQLQKEETFFIFQPSNLYKINGKGVTDIICGTFAIYFIAKLYSDISNLSTTIFSRCSGENRQKYFALRE